MFSRFVGLFDSCNKASTINILDSWKEGNGLSEWDKSLFNIQSYSVNSGHQLIQFKVVHRLHYSKSRLRKIYLSVLPVCDRCKVTEGPLSHTFWFWASLRLWTRIFDWYSKAYKKPIQLEAALAIFGCSQSTLHLPKTMQQSLMLGMTVAKRHWRNGNRPNSLTFRHRVGKTQVPEDQLSLKILSHLEPIFWWSWRRLKSHKRHKPMTCLVNFLVCCS